MSQKDAEGNSVGWFVLVVLIAAAFLIEQLYRRMDFAGMISHQESTSISANDNWFVGESKTCYTNPLDQHAAKEAGKKTGYAFAQIECDDGNRHEVQVIFYGREAQPEYMPVFWKCVREQTQFSCYELGGVEAKHNFWH